LIPSDNGQSARPAAERP